MRLLYSIPDPRNPIDALDIFTQFVAAVDEYDYGDCMREWNHDLLYLREHLKNTTPWALAKIDQMQEYIQFNPNWDVESTRKRILKDAHELHEHLVLNENAGRAA
jgi:hypothetical protein